MKAGRLVWFITGNISHDQAIHIADETRAKLKLKSIDIMELVKIKAVDQHEKVATSFEFELEDEENKDSCLITFYEIGL